MLGHIPQTKTFVDNCSNFSQAGCPSCHPSNSVKTLNETQSAGRQLQKNQQLEYMYLLHQLTHVEGTMHHLVWLSEASSQVFEVTVSQHCFQKISFLHIASTIMC